MAQIAVVAYQDIILGPGVGHFREFESRRVHTRTNSWGLFLVHKLTCGRRESVSYIQQHSMKNRRAVRLLNPMRDGKNRGEERTTPVTTACPEKLKST